MIMSGLCYAKSGLRFVEEDLSFGIADSVFSVEGIYYFESDKPGNYPILYPLPADEAFGRAYDIHVKDLQSGEELAFKFKKNAHYITFQLKVKDDTPILISYKQELYKNFARYILLSTHSWGQALERVEYKLKVSKDIEITYFSIEPDNHVEVEGNTLYLWQRENFMPDSDLMFEFQEK